jgi:GT2 family glycosyltransferase
MISVVLATKGNKIALLERCITSLQNQTFRDFEIVLVYSVFPEQLKELFETCNIATLKENSSTLGAARNLGVKHSRGEIVVLIDDDCEAPESWLERIYSTFNSNPSLFCLGGPHFTPQEESESNPIKFVEGSFLEAHLQTTYLGRSAVGKIAGCNVAYRKVIFEKIGYLNEAMRSGEDWEFHIRLVENGYSMRFDPKIFVWHHRQGLRHTFWNSSKMIPFFLSWKTLKYSKHESFFASFYLSNLLFLLLLITLFFSPFVFSLLLSFSLLGHFIFTAVRTKICSWRIIYYPLAILVTLARLMGFYFGLFKYIASKIHKSV